MPILWDAPLTAAVARELNSLLAGERLRAHTFRWETRELGLYFRSRTLLWSLHPTAGWIRLLPPGEPPTGTRPLAARVLGVEAPPDERWIRIGLQKLRGNVRKVELVVELMTNQWNALLLEGEERIIRHLLWTRRLEDRRLGIGLPYRAPAPSTRRGREAPIPAERWHQLLDEVHSGAPPSLLLERLAFTSSLNLPAILAASPDPDSPDAGRGLALWNRLRTLENQDPCILEIKRDKQPYPFVMHGFKCSRTTSILEAFREVAGVTEGSGADAREEVMERAERALNRARGRVRGLERAASAGADPAELRDRANLLLARLRKVPRGREHVLLEGFQGESVTLELDPSLSPRENAEALYQEAARMERARERIPPLLERARARVRELEALVEGLSGGTLSPEEAQAGLPAVGEGGRRESEPEERAPFRRYLSSGGLEIRVGRSSRENDLLTFRFARPDDVWLHARDAAGAHVILRWSGPGSPPARDLEEAAVLAALGSRARSSGVVPVDWTRKKYVRKPRKAPPGAVVPERVQTLFVEPDPGLPRRLRRGEEA